MVTAEDETKRLLRGEVKDHVHCGQRPKRTIPELDNTFHRDIELHLCAAMPRLHRSERALKLLADTARHQYVCRTCRAHQTRSFSTTNPSYARSDRPLLQRLREGIFGSTETTPAEKKREEASRERTKELAKGFNPSKPLEKRKSSSGGEAYEVAAVIDPSINTEYVPATTWDELETIGSEQWAKEREDKGEVYTA